MQACTMKTGFVICMRDTIETAFLIMCGTHVSKIISGTSGKKSFP